jgi:hypothetical protein
MSMAEPMKPANAPPSSKRGTPATSTQEYFVGAPQPVPHAERLAGAEGLQIGLQAQIAVVRVQAFGPAVAGLLIQGPAAKFQPGPVEIGTQGIRAGHPDHDGGGIRQQTEARFARLWLSL